MKSFRLIILALALGLGSVVHQGCSTPPSERVTVYQTLQVLGGTAKASMDASTQLLKQGSITVPQWQKIAAFYDTKWQPAYGLAVASARSDLSTVASPDLMALAAELSALVSQLTTH